MTPHGGSLSFLPATSWNLEGIFDLTQCPSRALALPHALLPELHKIKDTIKKQLTETLIVGLLKTHFLPPILDFEESTE